MSSSKLKLLEELDRDMLVNSFGVQYRDFRRLLTPKFHLVWLHLLAGYICLVLISTLAILMDIYLPSYLPVNIIVCGSLFGYSIAYIQLFLHEAAHYNIAKDREVNDKLANIFIGLMVGQNIKVYRSIHFAHHKNLGTPADTETTYFEALNLKFILESITGIKVLKVLSVRKKFRQSKQAPSDTSKQSSISTQLVLGAALNCLILVVSAVLGFWSLAGAWLAGVLIFFPFFCAIRQVLEHRDESARTEIDYHTTHHGQVNRMFGEGLLASTLGGAGFNRHMLHHWEPQVSYTRFKELEDFLMDTEAADIIQNNRTSYLRTFVSLFSI
ncbi:fatty acid desaturase [Allocoleopsis sp.]|uniref:fatty acid desaturase n=1 Tax=Allocoleopsis sp. TaxID=3088169 RepID=UPI002FD10B19